MATSRATAHFHYIFVDTSWDTLSKVKLGQVEVGSNTRPESLVQPLGSHIWSLFAPIHMQS